MIKQFLIEYADALAFGEREKALGVIMDALAAGVKPEDLISAAFITKGELASAQTRYLKAEFERGRFFLDIYENSSRLPEREFHEFVLKGAAALTDSLSACLCLVPAGSGGTLSAWTGDRPAVAGEAGDCASRGKAFCSNLPAAGAPRFMCVPAMEGGRGLALGVSGKGRDYDEYDLLQLQLTAAELHKARKRMLAREESERRAARIARNQAALLKLAKTGARDFDAAIRRILEAAAETLSVERVSYWRYDNDRSEIVCEDLYLAGKGSHEKGLRLKAGDYPRYFKAMEESMVVPADDAAADPRTSEFAAGYLRPLGITSMMDAPVRLRGALVGLVCFEHTGPVREWAYEDQSFAISVTDLISNALETSGRIRAETALDKYESRWRFLREGVQVIGFDWRYIYLNDLAARHGRVSREKLVGRTMMAAYPGIEKTEMFAKLRECMEKRVPQSMENRFVFPDGSAGWFELGMEPCEEGVIITSYETTERRQAQEKLAENEKKYRTLFEAMSEGFSLHELLFDGAGRPVDARVLDANPAMETQLGVKREEIIGRTAREISPKADPARFERYAEVLRTGRPFHFETVSGPLDRKLEVVVFKVDERRFGTVYRDTSWRERAQEKPDKKGK